MDVLSDLLQRSRAKNAVVRQLIQRPPWSITLADQLPISAVATLQGTVSITQRGSTQTLRTGDIALIKGGLYTIADDPRTPNQVIIREGVKHFVGGTGQDAAARMISSRTFGAPCPGAIVMLHGIYDLHGSVGDRLLDMLPQMTVVPAGPRTRQPLEMLSAEAQRDEPGQHAVLNRLLELVLVIALRSWGANADPQLPPWLAATADPAIGQALATLHADPRRRWTTATLAATVGMSRAAFSARFASLIGTPPMTYLTGWRMTLAADLLRDTNATIATVAREVGYDNAFAFSTAFKRIHGHSPTAWRRLPHQPGP